MTALTPADLEAVLLAALRAERDGNTEGAEALRRVAEAIRKALEDDA